MTVQKPGPAERILCLGESRASLWAEPEGGTRKTVKVDLISPGNSENGKATPLRELADTFDFGRVTHL